jgi:hypothetical protein
MENIGEDSAGFRTASFKHSKLPPTSKLPLKDTDYFHQLTCPFTLSPDMSSQTHNPRKIRNFHFKNY